MEIFFSVRTTCRLTFFEPSRPARRSLAPTFPPQYSRHAVREMPNVDWEFQRQPGPSSIVSKLYFGNYYHYHYYYQYYYHYYQYYYHYYQYCYYYQYYSCFLNCDQV